MSQLKIRTRVLTAAAALTLWPALASAQSGSASSPAQSSPNQSPDTSSQTAPAAPERSHPGMADSEGSDIDMTSKSAQQGSVTSQSQASMPKAPSSAGIDPAEVQKVFGTDVSLIELSSLDTEQVKQLQQSLQERGHYRGTVDGIIGPKTRSALTAVLAEQYALSQRLVNQGQIPEPIASSLGLDAQGRTPVSGIDMSGLPDQNQQQRPNVQSFPAPSNGQQQRATPPTNGQRGAPSAPAPAPTEPSNPKGSRTEDGRMDDYAPVTPR